MTARVPTAVALGLSITTCGCSFQRSAVVSREQALRVGSRLVVADDAGESREARVTRVRPISPQRALPDYHPETQDAPLFGASPTREQALSVWQQDPSWQKAELSLDVEEASGGWAIVGGAAVGAALAAFSAYVLTDCEPSANRNCDDSDALRAGAFFFLVPAGGLVGGVAGGVSHQLFGGSHYRAVERP
jgi:hypothetical protein